ncbi:hypothetical protein RHSIM_Rhsim05G0083000 [Rhododendron simsii]|uniref:DUF8040 domain-containing protein n=1 Tax=Rhododendron simsii TaxID=118357 RepID=A0A834GZD5_RHOSS|nr:hypothetical protein RHSIM_Rhsim05G0083000 [Rhododendron simsii]
MANPSWGNYGSPDDNGRGTFEFGNFTRLLESGVYPKNYPIFNSRNGGNELPNFNYPSAHQQSNELYQNGEGFGNMPWVNRFASTGQGDTGPSDNGPRVQQFVEEYNSLPHLYANSEFRQCHNSTGLGIEAQAGYDNWEWMNNNNGNVSSSTNVYDDDANSEYSISADEFYAEIAEDEMLVDILIVALLHAIQILRMPQRLPFHTCPLSGKAYLHELMNALDERFQLELCMPKDTFAKIVKELQEFYGWSSSRMKKDGVDCYESFAMFMHLLRGHSNRRTQERFQHSSDTVSRHVHKILACMRRGFTADKLKPTRRQDETHEYLDRRDFYKPFKGNCIGAIDGTHVMIRCKKKEDEKMFFSRKGYATQNIMAVDLLLASMAIHNYIRRDREPDNFFAPVSSAYEYAFEDLPDEDPELEDRLDERDDIVDEDNVPEKNGVRNNIRSALRRL